MSKLLAAHTAHCGAGRTDTLISVFGSNAAALEWALRCDLENRGAPIPT